MAQSPYLHHLFSVIFVGRVVAIRMVRVTHAFSTAHFWRARDSILPKTIGHPTGATAETPATMPMIDQIGFKLETAHATHGTLAQPKMSHFQAGRGPMQGHIGHSTFRCHHRIRCNVCELVDTIVHRKFVVARQQPNTFWHSSFRHVSIEFTISRR